MYHLKDAYESESTPTVATGILAVGISLLFTVGMFLIINANNNNQSQQLQQTIAAIEKSQSEGIDISTALAELKTASLVKSSKEASASVAPSGASIGNFDGITVKGTSALQGNVRADKDITIGGRLTSNGDLRISGSIYKDGVSLEHLYIQNTNADPQNNTSISADDVTTSMLTAEEISSGTLLVGEATADSIATGDLTISGVTQTDSLEITTDATITEGLTVGSTITLAGVDLMDTFIQAAASTPQTATINITGGITTAGDIEANSAIVHGTLAVDQAVTLLGGIDVTGTFAWNGFALEDLFIQTTNLSPQIADINITGGITTGGDFSLTGAATVGGALDVVGDISLGGSSLSTLYAPFANYLVDNGNGASASGCVVGQHIRITAVSNGIVTSASCVSDAGGAATYDLAENFPSVQQLSAGDVVAIDTSRAEYVIKSTSNTANLAIGVVSTAPGYTLGVDGPGYPVALAGRVPVKVTDEGGAIALGDYLTSSSTPGHAKKAAAGDKTIGQAMASFNGESGTVVMFINTSGALPAQELVQGTQSPSTDSASFTSLNVSGPTSLSDLQVTGSATIGSLQVIGTAAVGTLQIAGHIIGNDDTRGTVTVKAGEQTVRREFIGAFSKVPSVVASPVNKAVLYKVTPTMTGFDLTLTAPADEDTIFNYLVQE